MNDGHTCHRAIHRFLAAPTLGVLAIAVVAVLALYSMADAEHFSRAPRDVAVFGPR